MRRGTLDATGRVRARAARKRALTAESSSRWAGAITRTSEDQHRLAGQNRCPATIGLVLAGLPAATRDGRQRGAVSTLIGTARARGARALVIEDLDFAGARAEGREGDGNRPARGRAGRAFRRAVAGLPTGRLRDRLVQMAANAGLHVIVIDPAYRWGPGTGSVRSGSTTPRRPVITRQRW